MMMTRVLLVCVALVGGALVPVVVGAQAPVTDPGQFRFEVEEAQNLMRGRAVEGFVYNNLPWRITNVRLRVESLDATGAVTGETSGWVVGDVKSGGRGYFYVPVTARGATYRASVQSFDKVGLEVRPEAP
jgi:hypothetical protein